VFELPCDNQWRHGTSDDGVDDDLDDVDDDLDDVDDDLDDVDDDLDDTCCWMCWNTTSFGSVEVFDKVHESLGNTLPLPPSSDSSGITVCPDVNVSARLW
jgi:hypothetical protein